MESTVINSHLTIVPSLIRGKLSVKAITEKLSVEALLLKFELIERLLSEIKPHVDGIEPYQMNLGRMQESALKAVNDLKNSLLSDALGIFP
jgi:hypothetical protein